MWRLLLRIPSTPINLLNVRHATTFEIELKKFPKEMKGLLASEPFILFDLNRGPQMNIKITTDEAIAMYRVMQAIRKLETKAAKLYTSKQIHGFCHLYAGQEAVAGGITMAKRPIDTVVTSYRGHGWAYIYSHDAAAVLGELMGLSVGISKGKGGSMHMYAQKFFGGNGIVGAQVPLGAGIGLAHQYMKTGGVSFTLYGDGAANQGQAFEAFNLAWLLKLPVIFLCENNHYGMGTSAKRSSASETYFKRGDYMPGLRVNGMDCLAVREATRFCIDFVLENGPIVMEVITYRYYGHSMSDPGTSYRSRDEIQEVRKKADPIMLFRKYLNEFKVLPEDVLKKIDKEVNTEIEDAFKKCQSQGKPLPVNHISHDLFINPLQATVRGVLPWKSYPVAYDGFKDSKEMIPKNEWIKDKTAIDVAKN